MRSHPIGTGPFEFVEFKPNEHITVAKNPDYWKPDRPYLDGIEYTIIREQGPRDLAFYAGKFDMTTPFGVSIPTLKDFKTQAPQAICEISHVNVPRTMLINPAAPPFDNPDLRRAMALSVDRKAFVDILTEGEGRIGGNKPAGYDSDGDRVVAVGARGRRRCGGASESLHDVVPSRAQKHHVGCTFFTLPSAAIAQLWIPFM
jgi:ABC-type transport system substrate-binding protein